MTTKGFGFPAFGMAISTFCMSKRVLQPTHCVNVVGRVSGVALIVRRSGRSVVYAAAQSTNLAHGTVSRCGAELI